VYLSYIGVKREAFEPGVLRRNGTERRNEYSDAQLSDFYVLENGLLSNYPNAVLFMSAGASPLMRERRNN
jgi:hypothetical protein